jgi:hypothetical protein
LDATGFGPGGANGASFFDVAVYRYWTGYNPIEFFDWSPLQRGGVLGIPHGCYFRDGWHGLVVQTVKKSHSGRLSPGNRRASTTFSAPARGVGFIVPPAIGSGHAFDLPLATVGMNSPGKD